MSNVYDMNAGEFLDEPEAGLQAREPEPVYGPALGLQEVTTVEHIARRYQMPPDLATKPVAELLAEQK